MPKYLQILAIFLGFIIMFGLFKNKENGTPEENFWAWFQKNESRIFAVDVADTSSRDTIFDELASNMHKVNKDLTFEFSPVLPNGKREFVISADGIKSAFPAVESLHKQAPILERWTWVKFRPRASIKGFKIEMHGRIISTEDVNYLLFKVDNKNKVGIMMFFDGYNEENKNTFGQIGFILLDSTLGEYAVETQVDFVEFQSRESEFFSKSMPLDELQAHFDEYFERKVH
jgi:hypothetical protein